MPFKKPPLRVLFVSHTAELNGAEQMLLLTLKGLDRAKVAPYLAVPGPGPLVGEAERAGVPVSIVSMKWWLTERARTWKQPLAWLWNIPGVLRLGRLVRGEGIGLVFSNSSASFSGALAARFAHVPHVWSIHEILGGRERMLSFVLGSRFLARLIHGLSKKVIVNSSATKNAFARFEGIEIVPNGLDLTRAAGPRDARLRRKLGFAPKDRIIGMAGKVTPLKRQREAVLALAALSTGRPELRLMVVGLCPESKYARELQGLISRRGLEGKVVFTGFVADVFAHLRLMDLLLIASRSESFGRAAVEAMAAGVPVLAVSVGGLPEIIIRGETGFLVDSAEPSIMARGIEYVLDHPAVVRKAVGKARLAVKGRFEPRKQVSEVERIILRCGRPGDDNA